MSLSALGRNIVDGQISFTTTLIAAEKITGKVVGISVRGNTLTVENEKGERVKVDVVKTTSVND